MKKSDIRCDVLVVGAGIVGAACARELSLAGLRVVICERNSYPGGGATAAGMGHVAVMDDSAAQFQLTRYSQRLWGELACELPHTAEYIACGSLWIAADDEELAEAKRKFEFYRANEVAAEMLDAKQLTEAEPNLRAGLAGALFMKNDAVCYSPSVTRYLLDCAVKQGGELLLGKSVARVSDGEVTAEDGTRICSDAVVLATGDEVKALASGVEVRPRKGHLIITDRYPGFLHHQLIELGYLKSAHAVDGDSVAFNAQPRATGQILIGSSRQYGAGNAAVEQEILSDMLSRAMEYLPKLASLSVIRAWTGARAATPDKLPLIGRYPEYQRVYLATGHEGLGISTSLATARLLADEILGRASEIDRKYFDPNRSFVARA